MKKFLVALGLGIIAGVAVFIIGAILASVGTPAWLVSIGGVLKGLSGLVALVTFIYVLIEGIPTRGV